MTAGRPEPVSALVLAAGASTRLGEPKQAIRLDGQSLLTRAVGLASCCIDGAVLVVVGANASADRRDLADTPAQIHECDNWQQGQGASLSFGLARIPAGHAALVLVVDQYRLQPSHLRLLLAAWRDDPQRPAAARYAGTLGVPVVWPSQMIGTMVSSGRMGRDVLASMDCSEVPVPVAGFDLDTPQDLAEMRRFERSRGG